LPKSKPHDRRGADAAFANAMARAEFGRFYTDDRDLQEVRRSLARRRQEDGVAKPAVNGSQKPARQTAAPAKSKSTTLRDAPRLRERRTELAEALQRLRESDKQRG
jgi:hypothetical protein